MWFFPIVRLKIDYIFDLSLDASNPGRACLQIIFYGAFKNKMPKFSIRRRKKREPEPVEKSPEPEPMEEDPPSDEKNDEEEDEYMEDVDDAASEPPAEERRVPVPQPRYQAPKPTPRSFRDARIAGYAEQVARNPYLARSKIPAHVNKLNPTRSLYPDRPSRQKVQSQKMRFSSHFGPNGHSMSTQEKARALYFSCFGWSKSNGDVSIALKPNAFLPGAITKNARSFFKHAYKSCWQELYGLLNNSAEFSQEDVEFFFQTIQLLTNISL